MTDPVLIADYDPHWPEHFEALRSRIAAALGPIAAAIEHVGSTSVPGLAAKPIIDLDVLLRSSSNLSQAIGVLASLGYEHRGDLGIAGREAFRAPADHFPHHLYVCPPDSKEYWRHIAFRDYLRAHPEDAHAYAILKRRLAAQFVSEREAYNEGKRNFVEEILRRVQAASLDPFPRPQRTMM
jgi:GrpB-like predicted nucleotidyltransferase (UPF0157 family)